MKFSRVWAMPNKKTFEIPPIRDFVHKHLCKSRLSIDPFSGDKKWCNYNNDLAHDGIDAEEFLKLLASENITADLVLFDPPYSPRQISECYKSIGMEVGMKETQNAALYSRVKNAIIGVLRPGATVLSFGWNSAGMGQKHGFEIVEILLVCHGGAHNDTICLAEKWTR